MSFFDRFHGRVRLRMLAFAGIAMAPYAIGRAAPTEVPAPAPIDVLAIDRDFAQFALEAGMRAAYDRYLAADAIMFRPLPVGAREWLDTHEPASGRLEWVPALELTACDASLAVTLGTWNYTARDGSASDTGQYLTAWRRGVEGGDWRIVLDQSLSLAQLPALAATDTAGCDESPADGLRDADSKVNGGVRSLQVPGQSKVAVRAVTVGTVTGSARADLALTHGEVVDRKAPRRAEPGVRAVYVRVWQRQGRGWRLLHDFTSIVAP